MSSTSSRRSSHCITVLSPSILGGHFGRWSDNVLATPLRPPPCGAPNGVAALLRTVVHLGGTSRDGLNALASPRNPLVRLVHGLSPRAHYVGATIGVAARIACR